MTHATLHHDAGEALIVGLPHENIGTFEDTKASVLESDSPVPAGRFPWAALLIMALMGFLLIATETMPAGLLPQIAAGLAEHHRGNRRTVRQRLRPGNCHCGDARHRHDAGHAP